MNNAHHIYVNDANFKFTLSHKCNNLPKYGQYFSAKVNTTLQINSNSIVDTYLHKTPNNN